MTSHQLAQLNGLLARGIAERRRTGDPREPHAIAAEMLHEVLMPDLKLILQRLRRRVSAAPIAPGAPAASSN
jgi:hypothetical protein